jgi:hypothetical protein
VVDCRSNKGGCMVVPVVPVVGGVMVVASSILEVVVGDYQSQPFCHNSQVVVNVCASCLCVCVGGLGWGWGLCQQPSRTAVTFFYTANNIHTNNLPTYVGSPSHLRDVRGVRSQKG